MTKMNNYRIWLDRLGIASDPDAFRFMLLALVGLSIIDAAVSYIGIVHLGMAEGNPVLYATGYLLCGSVAALSEIAAIGMLIKVIGGGIIVGVAWITVAPKPVVLHSLLFVIIVYIMATISNLITLIGGIL
jgi:hypothetical protein